MSNETTFEKLGIEYVEIDGIFYPDIAAPTEAEQIVGVGKYGAIWIKHMEESYPQRYRSLVRFGGLKERAIQVNETAYELLEDIEVRFLRSHKPRNPNSFMEQLYLRNQARVMAEEVVLHDVVMLFH